MKHSYIILMKSESITHWQSMLLDTAELAVEGLPFGYVEDGSSITI